MGDKAGGWSWDVCCCRKYGRLGSANLVLFQVSRGRNPDKALAQHVKICDRSLRAGSRGCEVEDESDDSCSGSQGSESCANRITQVLLGEFIAAVLITLLDAVAPVGVRRESMGSSWVSMSSVVRRDPTRSLEDCLKPVNT